MITHNKKNCINSWILISYSKSISALRKKKQKKHSVMVAVLVLSQKSKTSKFRISSSNFEHCPYKAIGLPQCFNQVYEFEIAYIRLYEFKEIEYPKKKNYGYMYTDLCISIYLSSVSGTTYCMTLDRYWITQHLASVQRLFCINAIILTQFAQISCMQITPHKHYLTIWIGGVEYKKVKLRYRWSKCKQKVPQRTQKLEGCLIKRFLTFLLLLLHSHINMSSLK